MNEIDTGDRWRVLGRVVLFMLGCAVVLAAIAPLAPKLPGKWAELAIGTVAALVTFALTALFVRWERLGLTRVRSRAMGPRTWRRPRYDDGRPDR
jgi:hypothetical protein